MRRNYRKISRATVHSKELQLLAAWSQLLREIVSVSLLIGLPCCLFLLPIDWCGCRGVGIRLACGLIPRFLHRCFPNQSSSNKDIKNDNKNSCFELYFDLPDQQQHFSLFCMCLRCGKWYDRKRVIELMNVLRVSCRVVGPMPQPRLSSKANNKENIVPSECSLRALLICIAAPFWLLILFQTF